MKTQFIKIIGFCFLIIIPLFTLSSCKGCKSKTGETISVEKAMKEKKVRSLIIENKTNEIINNVSISMIDGGIICENLIENPDTKSYAYILPNAYDRIDNFTVTLIDRYGMKYEKNVTISLDKGAKTSVIITKNDYEKQYGDWKRKITKFFNQE